MLAAAIVLITIVVAGLVLDALVVFGAEELVDFAEEVLDAEQVEQLLGKTRCRVSMAHIGVKGLRKTIEDASFICTCEYQASCVHARS